MRKPATITSRLCSIIVLMSLASIARGNNLTTDDYPDQWYSHWVQVEGERWELAIAEDKSSVFVRRFNRGKEQRFQAETYDTHQDIIILSYADTDDKLRYKLVLSGWRIDETKMLYGTLLMYQKGVQYNGLSVTLSNRETPFPWTGYRRER